MEVTTRRIGLGQQNGSDQMNWFVITPGSASIAERLREEIQKNGQIQGPMTHPRRGPSTDQKIYVQSPVPIGNPQAIKVLLVDTSDVTDLLLPHQFSVQHAPADAGPDMTTIGAKLGAGLAVAGVAYALSQLT